MAYLCHCVHLEFSVFVYVLCPLSVQDELCLVGYTHNVVLHSVAQESGGGVKKSNPPP